VAPVELVDEVVVVTEPVQSETPSIEVVTNVDPVEQVNEKPSNEEPVQSETLSTEVAVQTETPPTEVSITEEVVIPAESETARKKDVEKFLPEIPNHAKCNFFKYLI